MNTIRMPKTSFKVWKYGLIVRGYWLSWYKGMHLYKQQPNSALSHSYNFYA